jgi:hypothetical protein
MSSTGTQLETTHLPNPNSVVKVGDGRGFVVLRRMKVPQEIRRQVRGGLRMVKFVEQRLIVTAAHCLSATIPCVSSPDSSQRIVKGLGTLDASKSDIWGECMFADPVADIAVIGEPDNQQFDEQADAYNDLVESVSVLSIGEAESGPGWMLSIDRKWTPATLEVFSNIYGTSLATGPTKAGQSGSPILNSIGKAVGVVAIGGETIGTEGRKDAEDNGPQPMLTHHLPAWLVKELR